RWQTWPLATDITLRADEQASVGTLDLLGPSGRIAHWRYTAGRGPAAHRLVQRLTDLRSRQAGTAGPPTETVCPSCGAVINAEDGRCPACTSAAAPPSLSA